MDVTIETPEQASAKFNVMNPGEDYFTLTEQYVVDKGATVSPEKTYDGTIEKDGVTYIFDGWYDNRGCTGGKVDYPYEVDAPVDFYAKYVPVEKYDVIYLPGANDGSVNGLPGNVSVLEGAEVTVGASPTRYGYKFTGWKADGLQGTETLQTGATFEMPGNDVKLTAQWEKDAALWHSVTYVDGVDGEEVDVPAGSASVLQGTEYTVSDQKPERTGWTFTGWKTTDVTGSEQTFQAEGTFTMPNKDVTLEAQWVAITDNLSISGYRGVYDSTQHGVTVSGTLADDEIVYSVDGSELENGFEDVTAGTTVVATVWRDGVAIWNGEAEVVITPAPLIVTTPSASKVYDGTALTAGPAEIEGVQGDDVITATAAGTQTEVGQSANTIVIEWNGLRGNYDLTQNPGTLTVFPQSIDPSDPDPDNPEPGDPDPSDPDPENPDQPFYTGVSVDSPSDVVYDGADHTWTPTVTDGDGNVLVAKRDYTVSYSTTDCTNVTGTITVTITGTGNFAGTVTRTYQVVPRPLVVQANDQTKVQGAADPALSSGYNPAQLVAGEEPGWTGGLTREAGEAVGTYAITQGTLALEDNGDFLAANYVLTVLPGTLTITAAPAPDNPPATTDDGGDDTPTTPAGPTSPVPDDALPITDAGDDATTDDATPEETVTDDENPLASGDEEGIEDNGNPLASGRGDEDCWVHWLILVGMILTAVYFVGVAVRRRKFTADLLDYEDKVLGNNRNDA